MAEPLRTKGEIWKEAHAERTECPTCGKFVTLRTLRWRHVCGHRSLPQRLLDAHMAELRRQELAALAVEAHDARMQERNGGPAPRKRRADQSDLGGAGQAGA